MSPQDIAQSEDLQRKARAWIRRELRVFPFLLGGSLPETSLAPSSNTTVEYLLTYVLSILRMVDLRAHHGHAENLLTEYLGRANSKLFLHELIAWLRSPFTTVRDWDREVQYSEAI